MTAHQSTGKQRAAKRRRRERSRNDSSSSSCCCTEETVEPPGEEKKEPRVEEKKKPRVPEKKKPTGEQEKEPTVSASAATAKESAAEFDAEELADIRSMLKWDEDDQTWFYMHILGGKWTLENKGVHADAAASYARKGVSTEWCLRFNYPRQASFMFRKYGREGAVHLAKEWCRRSHFFFMQWLNSDDGDAFAFSEDVLQAYQEPGEFVDWVLSLPVEDPCFDRACELRDSVPRCF